MLLATAAERLHSNAAQPSNAELDPAIKLMREGETEKALKSLKRVVKNNKLDGEAWYYLGVVYLQLEDFKKAADAFKKATEVRPGSGRRRQASTRHALVLRNSVTRRVGEGHESKRLEILIPRTLTPYTLAICDPRKGSETA